MLIRMNNFFHELCLLDDTVDNRQRNVSVWGSAH